MGIKEIFLCFNLWWWYSRPRTCSNPAPANVGLSCSSEWAFKYTIGSYNSLLIIWRGGNAWAVVYRWVIFLTCGTHLHDRIILLREDGCAHQTNLTRYFLLCLCQAWKVSGHVNERNFDIISCCEFWYLIYSDIVVLVVCHFVSRLWSFFAAKTNFSIVILWFNMIRCKRYYFGFSSDISMVTNNCIIYEGV